MNAAKPSDGLLSAAATLELMSRLAEQKTPVLIEQVGKDLAATTSASIARCYNTINLLLRFGLLQADQTGAIFRPRPHSQNLEEIMAECVASETSHRLKMAGSWDCLHFDAATSSMRIDSWLFPRMDDNLAIWLIEFRVAYRAKIQERFWNIAAQFHSLFLEAIRQSNAKAPRKAKTAAQLAQELEMQVKYGAEAEKWVLDYERRRLSGHPWRDQIRLVSQEDVAAGYDIASFSDEGSLHHNRFIEVKSHGAIRRFYWSRNEITTAEEFGEEYALYLVDRTKLDDPLYQPKIILGPSHDIFTRSESGWTVEATSFEYLQIESR